MNIRQLHLGLKMPRPVWHGAKCKKGLFGHMQCYKGYIGRQAPGFHNYNSPCLQVQSNGIDIWDVCKGNIKAHCDWILTTTRGICHLKFGAVELRRCVGHRSEPFGCIGV